MQVNLKQWQVLLEKGISRINQEDYVQAEMALRECLAIAQQLEAPVILAFSERILATVLVRNKKYQEAKVGFQKALALCYHLKNKKGIAEAKAGLASLATLEGQYEDAAVLYKQAIAIYPEDTSALRLAVLYLDLGHVYSRLKRWKMAEESFLQAESLCQAFDYPRGEAQVNLNLGEIYYYQQRSAFARQRFLTAARLYACLEEELSLANALNYLAFMAFEQGWIEDAFLLQYRVIALYLKHQQREEISEGYYLLSHIFQSAGLYDQAEDCIHHSLRYYQGSDAGLALRYHSLAVIAIISKEVEKAKKYYYDALKYFQFEGDGSKVGEICEELTYILRYEDAAIKDFLYEWLGNRDQSVIQSVETVLGEIPLYEIMIKLTHRLRARGNNVTALQCGWKALEIARDLKYQTQEVEALIQGLSRTIRNKKK